MSTLIRKDMSYGEFMEAAKALNVKFTDGSKDGALKHFNFNAPGNVVYDNTVEFHRLIAAKAYEVISKLKYNEILSPTQSISLLQPCDFTFRIFGDVHEQVKFKDRVEDCVTLNIQFEDFKGDIVKAWNNRVVSKINVVQSLKNCDEYINNVASTLRRKMDWGSDKYSSYIIVTAELFNYLRSFGTAYNVLEASQNMNNIGSLGNNTYIIRFKKNMTFEQVNTGNKIAFVMSESDSGIMGAKQTLNIGIFSNEHNMYYVARRED